MNLPKGAIPIEQWKPDGFKIMTILAEILGRQEGCEYEVVPAPKKSKAAGESKSPQQVIGA